MSIQRWQVVLVCIVRMKVWSYCSCMFRQAKKILPQFQMIFVNRLPNNQLCPTTTSSTWSMLSLESLRMFIVLQTSALFRMGECGVYFALWYWWSAVAKMYASSCMKIGVHRLSEAVGLAVTLPTASLPIVGYSVAQVWVVYIPTNRLQYQAVDLQSILKVGSLELELLILL